MRRKKKFTSVLSLVLSLLMAVSCIQPVMATQADPNVESVSEEATTQAEEKQTTNVLSFENTADQLSVELTKESDFDPGTTADINLLKDNAYEDVVENLKKSLEEKNEGYTINLDTPLATEVNVLDEGGNKKDAGKVSAKIFTDASVLKDSVLYHQKEDQTWEEIQFETAEDSSYVAFDAEKLGNFVFAKADLTKKEESKAESSDAAEPAALTDPEISPLADTDAYAILYKSGELVFQRGSTPDASKGNVLKTYTGFETKTYTGSSNYAPWYENRTSIKAVSFKDVVKPVSTAYWFYNCRNLTDVDFTNLNTSAVTNMDSMFSGCWALKSLDVSSFDTSAVTNMDSMFFQCSSLTSLDLSSFHTSAVTSMDEMFYGCSSLTSLDVSSSSFDTSAVTSMVQMFYACSSLTSLDLSSFDTKAVTNMDEMFCGCSSLTSLDLSSFHTPAVTSMDEMFRYCTSLTSLDVSSFDTQAVTSMDKMFWKCSSLTSLDLSSFNTSAITSMDSMFYECSSLTSLNVSSFDTSAVTDMDYMFCRCGALKSLDLSSFDTSAVRRMVQMFDECRSLTSLDVSSFDTQAVTNMGSMFSGCRSLTSLDVSSFNTQAVTDMDYMFSLCSSLKSLDVSKFDTSAVTNMHAMFFLCSSLTSLDLRSFNTSAVTDMHSMFSLCSSLTSLDVSSFNTSAVTDMGGMFYNCSSLTSLDLKSFNTQAVTSMDSMFFGVSTFTLGQNFTFKTGALPTSSTWRGLKQGKDYTDTKLQSTYDGTTMADTYVKYFDIKFDALGGKSSESKKFGYIGIAFDSLPTATKTGNVFLGWFTEKTGGVELKAGEPTTQSTYYAQYRNCTYNLVLKPNGPENTADITKTLEYSELYRLPEDAFSYEGYKLVGYNTRRDGSGENYSVGDMVLKLTTEDKDTIILYAQWDLLSNYAEVSFDTQGGNTIDSKVLKKGSKLGTLPESTKKNYTFINWRKDSLTGSVVNSNTIIDADTTLYAEWKKNPIVSFYSGISGRPEQRQVAYGKPIGTLPIFAPGLNMYKTFMGWFTSRTGGTQITAKTTVTEDASYYARWGWAPRFNANGGKLTGILSYPAQDSRQYTITTLPTAVRDGYTLTGWYLSDGVTKVKDGDTIDLSKGAEIVAIWKRDNTVKVTLNSNGGTINSSSDNKVIEYYQNTKMIGLYTPTRSGYNFLGWYDDADTKYDENSSAAADITLTAKWAEKVHTVTFNPGNGTMYYYSKTQKVADGDTIQTLPGARRTNYILKGWYTKENGEGEQLTTTTPIKADITYYAYYEEALTTSTDNSHMYTFGAEWSNASNSNVDNVNDNLEFHPSDRANQTASLHIRFELNQSIGDTKIPAKAIQIRVPKYVWKDWEENNTGSNNLSANIPKYPDISSAMLFSYKEDGDDYILVNNREMAGGAGLDVTISYTVSPWDVPGGAIDEKGKYVDEYDFYKGTVPVTVTMDQTLDGTVDLTTSKKLTLEMHTLNTPHSSKSAKGTFYQWDTSWGEKPADADDYFYVKWRLNGWWFANQPFSWSWSEDTVHDGTVVCYNNGSQTEPTHSQTSNPGQYSSMDSNDYVVMKYPVSLLKKIPAVGLVLENEAVLNVTMKSGYQISQRVRDTITIYDAQYPMGEFDKTNGDLKERERTIEGGQEDILDDKKDVNMYWTVRYNGASRKNPVTWDEDNQRYTAEKRTISFVDGNPGDVLYSSGEPAAKYIWEPVTGNVALTDNDYSFTELTIYLREYDSRQEDGVWTKTYEHSNRDDYESVDVYVRYRNSSDYVFYKSVPSYLYSQRVTLPDDVVGYKVEHDTSFYSTDMGVSCSMHLHPTKYVQTLVQKDVNKGTTSLIKNVATCDIWNTENKTPIFHVTNNLGGTNPANKVIYELNVSDTTQKTEKYAAQQNNTILDVNKRTQDNPIYIAGWNHNTSDRKKQIKTGTFYDLLPAGTTVDVNTLFGIPITGNPYSMPNLANSYNSYKNSTFVIDPAYYDVRFISNYEGSGRTMMVINFATPASMKATGMQFWYLLHNTYENVIENGTTVENDVAFVNTTEGAVIPYSRTSGQSVVTEAKYYDSIQAVRPDFTSYAKDSTNYIPVDAFSWGFTKAVKTQTEYETSAITIPNNEYTYRLSYSQSDDAKSSGIVFYDILEYGANRKDESGNKVFKESQWHGTLKDINVKSAEEKLTDVSTTLYCKPTVYYATKDRSSFTANDYDVTNTATWSTKKPADASTITAVAVDCSKNTDGTDFVMNGRQVLEIYVTMTAPTDASAYDKTAYNEGVVYSKKNGDISATPSYSDADVTLKNVVPELHKTSDPESGTKEAPKKVYQDTVLNYFLSVKNSDTTFTLQDLVVEDTLPDGLNIDTSNIQVLFGDISSGATAKNVAVTFDGSSKTESVSYDYVQLFYTLNGTTYSAGKFGGSDIAGKTIVLPTTDFYLYWKTDNSSDGYYGYKATVTPTNDAAVTGSVESLPSGVTVKEATSVSDLESKHGKYGNNVKELWHYTETDLTIPLKGIPISETPRATLEKKGKCLKFKINTLLPGEKINFIIPSTVTAKVGTVLKNTAKITSVNNVSKDIVSETTYHEVVKEVKNANITVSKTVAGAMGDKTKDFTFQLKMTGNTPAKLPYTKGKETGTLDVVNGVAKFTLSHGENIVLSEIPIGTTYEITEVDGASSGYTVKSTNSSGTLTEDTNVSFTNTRNGTVPTSAHTNILISIGLFAIALAGLFWYLRKRKQ